MSYVISKKTIINDSTASTSKTTGALSVLGGISSSENIHLGGLLGITGSVNTVNIKVQSSTSSYNFNLPSGPGSPGQLLSSNGGGSNAMSWAPTTGSGNVVLNSGAVFGIGGLTNTTGPTILGSTTIGAINGTSSIFSSTLDVNGLATFKGGLSVISGNTTLGATKLGAITGTSATFSSTLSVNNLATFMNGLTVSSGNTTIGSCTIGTISGVSAVFSSDIEVKGSATFGVGGLKSTTGITTLGNCNIGPLNGVSANLSSSLRVIGPVVFEGGLNVSSGNTNLGSCTTGTITGISLSLSSTLNVNGLASFNGGFISSSGVTTLGITRIGSITGTSATFSSSIPSSSKTTGAITVVGGISSQENINIGGYVGIYGDLSGVIKIKTQKVTGTYDFNLPTSPGKIGQILTSQGGLEAPMIWTTPTIGTVTSVTASVPSFLSVTSAPITESGRITINYSGVALPIENGGTGATRLNINSVLLGSSSGSIQSPTTITYSNSTLTLPKLIINDGTSSTGITSGSVLINGGISITNTADAISTTNGGTLTTAGGMAVAKKLYVGDSLSVSGNLSAPRKMQCGINSTNSSTGAVLFSIVFQTTPVVIANIIHPDIENVYLVQVYDISNTGFKYRKIIKLNGEWVDTAAESFSWIAMVS